MRGDRSRVREGGYVTVAVALLLFPALMMASLVLDLGFAGFLQKRMQSASDLAAREGPRGWRGSPSQGAWCADVADPACDPAARAAAWDAGRRARASASVATLHEPGEAGAPRVGPPRVPTLELGGGLSLSDPTVLALIDGEEAVYAEAAPLAVNSGDAPEGDLVGGRFVGRGTPAVVSCHDANVLEPFGENCRYERTDFVPSSAALGANRSFLARLRMTGEESVGGVSQAAVAVPVLFGRLVGTPGDPSAPPLRTRGLRVRAVAIGDARPALAAAPPVAGTAGVANFSVDVALWRTLPVDSPLPVVDEPSTGILTVGGVVGGGRVVASPLPVRLALGSPAAPIPGIVDPPAEGESATRWIPLHRLAVDGVERIVGFGVATLEPGTPPLLTKLTARVGASGVAAAPDLRETLAGLASAVINDLFAEYREARACDATDTGLGLVCAGVLVR